MKELTFIITFKNDGIERLINLKSILTYYISMFPDSTYIIIEDSNISSIPIDILNISKNIVHELTGNSDHLMRKSQAMNHAVRLSSTPYLCMMDSDAITNKDSLTRCVEELKNGYDYAFPHHTYWIKLNRRVKYEFLGNGMEWNYLDSIPIQKDLKFDTSNDMYSIHYEAHFCVLLYKREKYISIGGSNEKFIGWGGEDDELYSRSQKFQLKLFRDRDPHAKLFHLWHPIVGIGSAYDINVNELKKVWKMNINQLQEYITEDFFYH